MNMPKEINETSFEYDIASGINIFRDNHTYTILSDGGSRFTESGLKPLTGGTSFVMNEHRFIVASFKINTRQFKKNHETFFDRDERTIKATISNLKKQLIDAGYTFYTN